MRWKCRGEAPANRHSQFGGCAQGIHRNHPRIEWHEGNAAELPFAGASFQLVLCQQGLQFFTDRRSAVAEVHRVTTPYRETDSVALADFLTVENGVATKHQFYYDQMELLGQLGLLPKFSPSG